MMAMRPLLIPVVLLFHLHDLTAATIPLSNTADSGGGSLRAAIDFASAGDTIVFQIPTSDLGTTPRASALVEVYALQ